MTRRSLLKRTVAAMAFSVLARTPLAGWAKEVQVMGPVVRHWIGGAGDWLAAGNWEPFGVPVDGDSVMLDSGADVTVPDVLLPALDTLSISRNASIRFPAH
jgi:hypothetical protein